jgi:hypothetical protein
MEFDFSTNIQGMKVSYEGLGQHSLHYHDQTVQTVRITEVSDERIPGECSIAWEMIASDPSIGYLGRTDQIKLRSITYGETPATVIELTSTFSSDAGNDVVEDSHFKKRELIDELAKFAACLASL